ncbi:MAG: type II toxin-antitoxin system RelE/ParE family toxin [Azoarcus sp.]|jgi:plasmid stabilization system protein ParE|nr:type II toxin-antitoxin system RelE/ParE family toxin [Azoarcus sp.]
MPRLIWSPPALRDIQRLYRFLASKNPEAAKRAVHAIRQGVRILGRHPEMGRLIADLPEQYREWLIDFGDSGYVARYRIDTNALTMLAVWHQKEAGI